MLTVFLVGVVLVSDTAQAAAPDQYLGLGVRMEKSHPYGDVVGTQQPEVGWTGEWDYFRSSVILSPGVAWTDHTPSGVFTCGLTAREEWTLRMKNVHFFLEGNFQAGGVNSGELAGHFLAGTGGHGLGVGGIIALENPHKNEGFELGRYGLSIHDQWGPVNLTWVVGAATFADPLTGTAYTAGYSIVRLEVYFQAFHLNHHNMEG